MANEKRLIDANALLSAIDEYMKNAYERAKKTTIKAEAKITASMHKVYAHPELAKFTPRQLMEELKSRGFKWEYMLEPQRKIMFEKI